MILELACTAFSFGFGQAPTLSNLPQSLEGHDVRTLMQASPTHFAAENLGQAAQMILVGDPRHGVLSLMTLPPGQRIEHLVSSAALASLWVEVVERDQSTWTTSGAFPLSSLRSVEGPESNDLWIERTTGGLLAWSACANQTPIRTTSIGALRKSPASPRTRNVVQDAQQGLAPHVPGAPPTDQKKDDTPPKVPDKTLPPF
ncbi:MAG: hypothetical protein ACI8QC_000801 [Planctomycetota bacterium]|jgi:hypothetical protein